MKKSPSDGASRILSHSRNMRDSESSQRGRDARKKKRQHHLSTNMCSPLSILVQVISLSISYYPAIPKCGHRQTRLDLLALDELCNIGQSTHAARPRNRSDETRYTYVQSRQQRCRGSASASYHHGSSEQPSRSRSQSGDAAQPHALAPRSGPSCRGPS